MIKLVVFDWDDVFTFGSTNGYITCYHQALLKVGVELSPKEELKRIKAKWGSTARSEISEFLQEKPELIDKAVDIYEQTLMGNTFVNCLKFIDGGNKLIEQLSKKYKLAIASGVNPRLLQEKIFPKFKVKNVFSEILTVYDIDDSSHAKPHPYLLLEIMRRLKVKPEETVMVGDARGDAQMAKDAGVVAVVVLTGHLNKAEAESLGVKYIIKDVTDLELALSDMEKWE